MEKSKSSNIVVYIAATADFDSAGTGLAFAVPGVLLILIGIFKGRIFKLFLELISGLF